MGESDKAPWRFSPFRVVVESLLFLAAGFPDVARWSAAPVVYGLGFHIYLDMRSGSGDFAPDFGAVLLLALVLLWIRVPLEVRLYRRALLGETPARFYGQELLARSTFAYLWAYVRMIGLFAGCVMAATSVLGMALGLMDEGAAEAVAAQGPPLPFVIGVFLALGAVFVWLAPRVVLLFPEVALGGPGRLFPAGGMPQDVRRARWRIVAVAAIIWTPEFCLNVLTHAGLGGAWWKAATSGVWYLVASFLVGLGTLILSCVAGARMYGLLMPSGPRAAAPPPEEED